MRRGPAVGQHLIQPRIVRMQAEEKLAYIAPWLESMALHAGQDSAQHSRPRTSGFAAQEEPVLSANSLVPKGPLAHIIIDR